METKLNFRTKLTNCAERGGVKLLSILFLTMWMLFASKTNAQLYVGTNDTIYTNLDSTLTSSGANPPAVSYPTLTMNAYTPDESLTQFLNSKLNSYTIKSISLSDVYSLFNDSKYGQHFHFMLNNQDVIMHTQIHDLRSPIYTQSTQSQEGETIVVKENAGDIHNYSGVIENDNDADVRFNVYSDYVFGFIYKKEAKLFYYIETLNHLKLRYKITPNSGDENKLIIYMDYDSKVDNPQLASCTENGSGKTRLNKKIPEDPCAPYVVEFVVDADYSYYHNKFNNNYNDVKRALFDELNITESVYSSNFDIIFSINKTSAA